MNIRKVLIHGVVIGTLAAGAVFSRTALADDRVFFSLNLGAPTYYAPPVPYYAPPVVYPPPAYWSFGFYSSPVYHHHHRHHEHHYEHPHHYGHWRHHDDDD